MFLLTFGHFLIILAIKEKRRKSYEQAVHTRFGVFGCYSAFYPESTSSTVAGAKRISFSSH